jgi:hypothetical protein
MSLKTGNSRRVAKSRPVYMDLNMWKNCIILYLIKDEVNWTANVDINKINFSFAL